MLPRDHWISLLITRHFHQIGHAGVATTVSKIRTKFWIIRAHDLAKSVKFRCVCCREIEARTETQLMADLPRTRLEPFTPPFHYTAYDYFGLYKVKISRNNHQALWSNLYLYEHESCTPGAGCRLFYR